MTAAPIPHPVVARERAAALARVTRRDDRPPTRADWLCLKQHGVADKPAVRVEGDAFVFTDGEAS